MPHIKEYNNTQTIDPGALSNLGRAQEVGGYQSGLALAGGINDINQGVKDTENHIAQTETTKLAADMATAHAELADQWRQEVQKADPNDHELASRFMEKVVKPRLEGMGQNLITEQGNSLYSRASAGLAAELFTRSAADQAGLAGEAAITNLDTTKNQLSNVVRGDPSSLENVQSLANITIDGLVSAYGLPREKAEQLGREVRGQIAKSAAYGAADLNPDAALQSFASGRYDKWLDGTEVKAAANYATDKKRTDAAAQRTAEVEQRRKDADTAERFAGDISSKAVDPDTGREQLQPDYFKAANDYRKLPEAKLSTYNELVSAGERILNNPLTHDAPGVVTSLLDQTLHPGADGPLTRDQVLSHVGRDLSQSSANFIMDQLKDTPQNRTTTQLINQTLSEAKETLGVGRKDIFGQLLPGAQRDYSTFEAWFLPTLQKQMKAGKDPTQLLNPESPDYMLKDKIPYSRFKSHPSDQVQETLQRYAPQKPVQGKRPSLDDIFGK